MKIEIYDIALAWQKIQGFSPSKKKRGFALKYPGYYLGM